MVEGRLDYPDGHIEVDNRLAWFLGPLDRMFGDAAVWVHLVRDPGRVAASFARRPAPPGSLLHGFTHGILGRTGVGDRAAAARLMVDTINTNIAGFLAGKERVVTVPIEAPHDPFDTLWNLIGAEGDLAAAHATLNKVHNK